MPPLDPNPSLCQLEISQLLETMPQAVFLVDRDLRLRELNSAAERFAGQSASELRGTHIRVLGQALGLERHPDETQSSLGVSRALKGETVCEQRRVFSRPNGHCLHAVI